MLHVASLAPAPPEHRLETRPLGTRGTDAWFPPEEATGAVIARLVRGMESPAISDLRLPDGWTAYPYCPRYLYARRPVSVVCWVPETCTAGRFEGRDGRGNAWSETVTVRSSTEPPVRRAVLKRFAEAACAEGRWDEASFIAKQGNLLIDGLTFVAVDWRGGSVVGSTHRWHEPRHFKRVLTRPGNVFDREAAPPPDCLRRESGVSLPWVLRHLARTREGRDGVVV